MSLETRIKSALSRVATEFKTLRTLISGSATGDLSGLTTTDKSSLVAAINEASTTGGGGGGGSGDLVSTNNLSDVADPAAALANLGGVDSAQVNTQIQAVVGAAPASLDTLQELATALGDDPNFSGTVLSALSNRVRVDAAQSFTAPQQQQGRDNIGAIAASAIGDPEADLVVHFEGQLV